MSKMLPLVVILFIGCQSGSKPFMTTVMSVGRPLSIMQGVTTDTWTQITLHRQRSKKLDVSFETKDGSKIPEIMIHRSQKDFQASEWVIDGFVIHGINPKGVYKMIVKEDGKIVDQRTFSALEQRDDVKFAVVSCMNDYFKQDQKKIWEDLISKNPEVILAIGDNSYADMDGEKAVPEASSTLLWRRYSETRQAVELYHIEKLIPVIATWDDHDYGMNDGDRRYKTKNDSQAIFYSFFQQDFNDPQFSRGPGVSAIYRHGKQSFVFLDNRTYRSMDQLPTVCKIKKDHKYCQPRENKNGPDVLAKKEGETHFGQEQEKWLLQQLKATKGPVYLIAGDQWFGGYHPFESYEGNHPRNFKDFMAKVAKTKARVVFIGGDRHNFELSRIEKDWLGYETFELISSPIHSSVYPSNWVDFPNSRQIAGVANVMNYSIVDSTATDQALQMKIETYKLGGEKISDHTLSVPMR